MREIPDVVQMEGNVRVISWDKENAKEVALAEKKFEEHVRQGWLAFTISSDNEKIQLFDFNPELEKIFLVPLSEGG